LLWIVFVFARFLMQRNPTMCKTVFLLAFLASVAASSADNCPGADPAHCNCSWTHSGKSCGDKDDGSECYCRCCCPYRAAGFQCKWNPPPSPSPGPGPSPPPPSPPSPTPSPGKLSAVLVEGNRLVDGSGKPVVLRGVSHSGSEYQCVHGAGIWDGTVDQAFVDGLKSWKNLNSIRLPMNEDCWLGISGVPSSASGKAYQTEFKRGVDLLTSNNIAVLVDLHWTKAGSDQATGQQPLPDRDHAPTFWSQVAKTFKDNPLVLFELFNEPFLGNSRPSDDDWRCWSNATNCKGLSFQPAGQRELLQAIRATGAKNVVLMGGMTWSNDLSKWLQYAPLDADPLRQIAAVWHSYANNACNNEACWNKTVASVAKEVPVVVTECGHGVSWAQGLFDWIEAQGGTVSYLPWAWNTWGPAVNGKGEALVEDYDKGTPTEHWGTAVKNAFAEASLSTGERW
jgi:hypothetical protein